MKLFHDAERRSTRLLASGVLEGAERAAAVRHVEDCAECQAELRSLEEVLELVAADPLRQAEPPLPPRALVARVRARLREKTRERRAPSALIRPAVAFLAAALAIGLALKVVDQGGPRQKAPPSEGMALPEDSLRRAERTLTREQTARYLSAAQDVLVTVVAAPQRCLLKTGHVDVGEEAQRSRELLAKRALLVEMGEVDVASAKPVLEDVERVLREVASLDACARARDLEAIHREVAERRLLMKIDLMTEELKG